jgi:hypothetical protein
VGGADLARGLDAVETGHAPVSDDEIRSVRDGLPEPVGPVAGFPHDLVARVAQGRGEGLADVPHVVDNHHVDLSGHRCLWPRSLGGELVAADRLALRSTAEAVRQDERQKIMVHFGDRL